MSVLGLTIDRYAFPIYFLCVFILLNTMYLIFSNLIGLLTKLWKRQKIAEDLR